MRPKGRAYLGVFLKIYNHNPDRERTSAPGYLLEPSGPVARRAEPVVGEPVQAGPGRNRPRRRGASVPGSPSAAGPIAGGLLLYVVSSEMTDAQPFRLVINTGTKIGAIALPPVPKIGAGDTSHG